MIAITFAMELTVLRVSLYWQSSLGLACGHFPFLCLEQELKCRGRVAEASLALGCRLAGQREQQGSRGRDVTPALGHQEILTWSTSICQSCWGRSTVGHTGHACMVSGPEQVWPLVPGEQLMLAQLLLLGTFSWNSSCPWTAESSALPPAPAAAAGAGKDL